MGKARCEQWKTKWQQEVGIPLGERVYITKPHAEEPIKVGSLVNQTDIVNWRLCNTRCSKEFPNLSGCRHSNTEEEKKPKMERLGLPDVRRVLLKEDTDMFCSLSKRGKLA